jgi:hypothetical protein
MTAKQKTLLARLPHFQAHQFERGVSRFYTIPRVDNFVMAEQIHTHHAVGECQADYADMVDYWLSSLFNTLEDRYEANFFEEYARESLWQPVIMGEMNERTAALFRQIQNPDSRFCFETSRQVFCMLDNAKIVAYLVETETEYASFFWHAVLS